MAKGGSFERVVCKQLSNWWTDGEDDSCFWRTAMSGGRATVRGRQGKKTRGHCGDICATDEEGRPLTDLITFELKHGYPGGNFFNLIDMVHTHNPMFGRWIQQAEAAAERAGTPFWAIIYRRNAKRTVIFFPYELCKFLDSFFKGVIPSGSAYVRVGDKTHEVCFVRFGQFLSHVSVDYLKSIWRDQCKRKKK